MQNLNKQLDNTKENEFLIKLVLSVIVVAVITLILKLSISLDSFSDINIMYKSSDIYSKIIYFLFACSCLFYLKRLNEPDIFIIQLIYIVMFLQIQPMNINYFDYNGKLINLNNTYTLLNSLFCIIILSVVILPFKKIKKIIMNNKIICIIIVSCTTIFLSILEYNINFIQQLKTDKFILYYEIFLAVVYFLAVFYYIVRSIKKLEVVYVMITCGMMMLALRAVFIALNIKRPRIIPINNIVSLSFMAYILMIIGLFFEVANYITINTRMNNKVKYLYELIENNIHTEIIMCDKQGKIIYCNERLKRKFKKLTSLDATNENINEKFQQKISYIDELIKEDIIASLKKKRFWKGEIKFPCSKVYKINIQKLNINEIDETYLITFADISEKYIMRERIKENNKKIRIITENIKDLIILVDDKWNIEYINESMSNLIGYTRNELIGNSILNYVVGEVKYIKQIEVTGEAIIHSLVLGRYGNKVRLETIRTPIYDEKNKINNWVLVCRDLEYRDELEALKVKYDEIKEYNEVKNNYFANLSHELRTPTNVIYSSIQLLNSQLDNDKDLFIETYKKYEGSLKRNCFRMLRLITNIIDVTKIESGHMQLEYSNVDIVNLVEEITLSIIPYVEEMKMNIVFDTAIEELTISCDVEKIERVILNLLSNAIKFTSAGGSIFVSVSSDSKWVYIKVKDDGIGVPDYMKDKIFERFVQVNKSLNRLKEGSGIGLALVKSIISLHEGEIYLNNQVEIGSEFVVKLPNKLGEFADSSFDTMIDKPINEKILIELSDIYGVKKKFNK